VCTPVEKEIDPHTAQYFRSGERMRVLLLLSIWHTRNETISIGICHHFLFCLVVTSLGRVDTESINSALGLQLPLPAQQGPFRNHRAKRSVLTIRGGALSSTTSTTTASSTSSSLGALIRTVGDSISSSKSKCWTVLILSILTDTVASTLSKHARDTGSFNIFLAACCLNLLWYVQ
jgi:hypothetical protein